jgi:hypothetical protein
VGINRKFFFEQLKNQLFGGETMQRTTIAGWAYSLGTAYHEVAFTMQPIHERGGPKYFFYIGNPDLALDPAIASKILFTGLKTGLFTGKKLPQYFNKTAEDWINARRIVNKLDKAPQIAAYAKRFYGAIGYTTG